MNTVKTSILLLTLSFFSLSVLYAEEEEEMDFPYWDNGLRLSLNYAQVGFKNWSGGGESSISLSGFLNTFANREAERTSWQNSLELGYGLTRMGESDSPFRKNEDRIILVSKFGHKLTEVSSITAFMDFRTQFDSGFRYYMDGDIESRERVSQFMAPAFTTVGLGYEYKPFKDFYVILSPIAGKFTFVLDDDIANLGIHGQEPGENFHAEVGSTLSLFFKREIIENVNFQTRLFLFNGYEDMTKVDINWETLLTLRVTEYINASVSTQLIYDENIKVNRDDGTVGPSVQFKHVLAAGVAIALPSGNNDD